MLDLNEYRRLAGLPYDQNASEARPVRALRTLEEARPARSGWRAPPQQAAKVRKKPRKWQTYRQLYDENRRLVRENKTLREHVTQLERRPRPVRVVERIVERSQPQPRPLPVQERFEDPEETVRRALDRGQRPRPRVPVPEKAPSPRFAHCLEDADDVPNAPRHLKANPRFQSLFEER